MTAATNFLQLTKSMCKHFIEDEHYNYFDDLYTPEYTIHDLVDYFNSLITQGKLPEDVKNYLHRRWAENHSTLILIILNNVIKSTWLSEPKFFAQSGRV